MASAIFDTHAVVKPMTAAGMPVEQAEILADEHARLPGEQLAAKQDVALLRTDLERPKDQLTIRLGSMPATAVAIIAALVKLL